GDEFHFGRHIAVSNDLLVTASKQYRGLLGSFLYDVVLQSGYNCKHVLYIFDTESHRQLARVPIHDRYEPLSSIGASVISDDGSFIALSALQDFKTFTSVIYTFDTTALLQK
ncbi:MAG: hypothetical protein ACOC0P_02310, partial [Planctomycetota bacterium]